MTETIDPKAFLSRAGAATKREGFQRQELRAIVVGADNFVLSLDRQDEAAGKLMRELEHLAAANAGYAPQSKELTDYTPQLEELEATRAEIAELKRRALAIRQSATRADSKHLGAEYAARTRKEVDLLCGAEALRQVLAARVQGPMVATKVVRGKQCNGMLGEAIVRAVRFIRSAFVTPSNRVGHLWRWLTRDGPHTSIWLYHHHPENKWECLFFRIEITPTVDDLDFVLETYIPFGFPGDPAQYVIADSKVYSRPGWRRIDVVTGSYNRGNTYSLNSAEQRTAGVSFGVTNTLGRSEQESITDNDSVNESVSLNEGISTSYSWFENYGGGHSGSMQGGSSSNWGRGQSSAKTASSGRTDTRGTSHGRATTKGHVTTSSESESSTSSESVAHTIGHGFALTEGTTLQVEEYNFGIDYSLSVENHVKQWRTGNPEAARVLDAVERLFESLCESVIDGVRGLGVGTNQDDGRDLDGRMEELRALILVEAAAAANAPALALPPGRA